MPLAHRIVERQRFFATQNDAREVVIVEVGADTGQIGNNLDAVLTQQFRRPQPRQLQQLRRIDRARGNDDLEVGHGLARFAGDHVFDAGRAPPFEQNSRSERCANDLQIAAFAHRIEIGHGGG